MIDGTLGGFILNVGLSTLLISILQIVWSALEGS